MLCVASHQPGADFPARDWESFLCRCEVSRQSRRLEMMIGSKRGGPLAVFRRRVQSAGVQDCGCPVPPHPNPLPQGEGETFGRALVIRSGLVVVCLRNERRKRGLRPQRPNIPAPRQCSPSPRGEGWGEGNEANSNPRHMTIPEPSNFASPRATPRGFPIWL